MKKVRALLDLVKTNLTAQVVTTVLVVAVVGSTVGLVVSNNKKRNNIISETPVVEAKYTELSKEIAEEYKKYSQERLASEKALGERYLAEQKLAEEERTLEEQAKAEGKEIVDYSSVQNTVTSESSTSSNKATSKSVSTPKASTPTSSGNKTPSSSGSSGDQNPSTPKPETKPETKPQTKPSYWDNDFANRIVRAFNRGGTNITDTNVSYFTMFPEQYNYYVNKCQQWVDGSMSESTLRSNLLSYRYKNPNKPFSGWTGYMTKVSIHKVETTSNTVDSIMPKITAQLNHFVFSKVYYDGSRGIYVVYFVSGSTRMATA